MPRKKQQEEELPLNLQFEQAKERVIGIARERQGIGTLSEKTVHAVLKRYYAPDEDMHEIPIENYVADIYTGTEIIEIQTRQFNRMREKLDAFLRLYPVTIVYPIPRYKWLIWIDEESGEPSKPHKSPVKGSPYMAFAELYKIKSYLRNPNLHLKFVLLDMEEYRLLNGWSQDKKEAPAVMTGFPSGWWRKSVLTASGIICSLCLMNWRSRLLRNSLQKQRIYGRRRRR